MYTQLWFICNFVFVALLIVFLFQNRMLQDAQQSGDAGRVAALKRRRLIFGLVTVLAFAAMAGVLLTDMHLNG